MAKMPKGLELWRPAYGLVSFHGVPMYRCHAWALYDYELHGGHLIVNSAIRTVKAIKWHNRKFHTHLHSQQYLYDHQHEPGFFPANKPNQTSHVGYADGNPFYGPIGSRIPRYKWGIDATQRPGGDASSAVSWLNKHGYSAERPYSSNNERHHFSFVKSPATNARKRLARRR